MASPIVPGDGSHLMRRWHMQRPDEHVARHESRMRLTRRGVLGSLSGAAGLLLAACGGQRSSGADAASSAAPAKLSWAYWGNQDQVTVREQVFDEIQKKHPNITIDKIWNTGSLDEHFAKVQVLVSS